MGKHLTTARSCALVAIAALGLSACGALGDGDGDSTVTVTESSQDQSQTSEPTAQSTTTTPTSTASTTESPTESSTASSSDVTNTPPAGSTPNTDTSKSIDVNTLTEKVEAHTDSQIPPDVTLSCMGGLVLVANETQKCSWMDSNGNVTRLTITVDWAAVVGDQIQYNLSLENSAYTP
ncbi:hypothetical protein [Janibacter indicus]|uniref:DUF4333 domain-containing protein n=1 Tax=Janibacter indicus TaxID=857417 RepID=A0A1W2BAD2_9MICO|nr:hypothetical protein [Janibacter indicus]SMC69751.1 hypothetical protein SAMN06296429_107166 [Janibacter indicus]